MKPKTFLLGFAALLVLLAFTVVPVAAVKPEGNNGNAKFVELVEKTPVDSGPYPIVVGGASGKLMYKDEPKQKFVFNAHDMESGTEYSLISYNENWGGDLGIFGTGIANMYGDVHITGTWDSSKLICNNYGTATSEEYSGTGSKIWLVPTADIPGDVFGSAWNPTTYLFEKELINVGCTITA